MSSLIYYCMFRIDGALNYEYLDKLFCFFYLVGIHNVNAPTR